MKVQRTLQLNKIPLDKLYEFTGKGFDVSVKLDMATKELLYNYFYFRYIGSKDEVKFIQQYQRECNLWSSQYTSLLAAETMDLDWFSNYIKVSTTDTLNKTTKNLTDKDTIKDITNVTYSTTETPNIINTREYDTSNTSKDTGTVGNTSNSTQTDNLTDTLTGKVESTTDTTTNNNLKNATTAEHTENSGSKQLSKETPMSVTNSSSSFPDELNWSTTSVQGEGKNNASANDTTSSTNTGTVDVIGTSTDNTTNTTKRTGTVETQTDSTQTLDTTNTNTQTGTVTDKQNGMNSTQGTSEDTYNRDLTKTQTGSEDFDGLSETTEKGLVGVLNSEALIKAREAILSTNAFFWLVNKLSVCFYNLILDEEDDDEEGSWSAWI